MLKVQWGHRFALMEMAEMQEGHSLVVGVTGACSCRRFIRFTWSPNAGRSRKLGVIMKEVQSYG
ncbi:MAG: hypothetical protein K6T80_05215 [Firmicutes bacterium]|nr:hypothetical protein [Bacillota bacterium]